MMASEAVLYSLISPEGRSRFATNNKDSAVEMRFISIQSLREDFLPRGPAICFAFVFTYAFELGKQSAIKCF